MQQVAFAERVQNLQAERNLQKKHVRDAPVDRPGRQALQLQTGLSPQFSSRGQPASSKVQFLWSGQMCFAYYWAKRYKITFWRNSQLVKGSQKHGNLASRRVKATNFIKKIYRNAFCKINTKFIFKNCFYKPKSTEFHQLQPPTKSSTTWLVFYEQQQVQ